MNAYLPFVAAALVAHPIPNPEILEPSVQNEVERAIARGEASRLRTFAERPGAREALASALGGADRTSRAIRLVSSQRADGSWSLGATNVTETALRLLRELAGSPPESGEADSHGPRVLRRKADDAWMQLTRNVLHPKTGMLSDGIAPDENKPGLRCERYYPTPAEISRQFPNPAGLGTAMEDGVLHTVPMLLAALARHRALGDAESADVARRIFAGLKRCVEIPGNGFLARNISPFDMKSFYWNCSRDQYTQWVYGVWRFCTSPLADARDRADGARLARMVAAYHERHVTPTNGFNSVRYDGQPAIFCRMWVADPYKKPVLTKRDGGSVDGLCAHEALRLHEIYLAAWTLTGERHWKDLYDRIIEGGLHLASLPLRENLSGFTSFQMQLSQRLLWEVDPDPVHRRKLLELLGRGAGCALASFAFSERKLAELKDDVSAPMVNWRRQKFTCMNATRFGMNDPIGGFAYVMPEFSNDFGTAYAAVREFGEGMCDRFLAPGLAPSPECDAKFDALMARIDFTTHCSAGAVYPLLAYWWRLSPES